MRKRAASRTANNKVEAFAQQMVTGHTSVNKGCYRARHELKVTPQQNRTSKVLQAIKAVFHVR